jgi:hypothetical protein
MEVPRVVLGNIVMRNSGVGAMDNMVLMAAWNNMPDPGLMPKDKPRQTEAVASDARGADRPNLRPRPKKSDSVTFRPY